AGRPVAEPLDGETRQRLTPQLALHDELARAFAHALERGGGETAVRRRLAVGRAIRANLGEASRRRSDADAALAHIAFVLAARQAEHDAAFAEVGVATAAGEAARLRHLSPRPHRDAH